MSWKLVGLAAYVLILSFIKGAEIITKYSYIQSYLTLSTYVINPNIP